MSLNRVTPSGFWTGSDYVGTMPDGKRQKFPTEREYSEEFETVLEEDVKKLKEQEKEFNAVKKEVRRWLKGGSK